MKTNRNIFMILVGFLMLLSCSKDDNPDPRADFEGEYTMEEFQYRFVKTEGSMVMDTTLIVESQPSINILRNNEPKGIDLELDGFIYTVINRIIEANESNKTFEIESHDPFMATLNNNGFQFDRARFNIKVEGGMGDEILESTIAMMGTMGQGHLNMEFTITSEETKSDVKITGHAVGTKQ